MSNHLLTPCIKNLLGFDLCGIDTYHALQYSQHVLQLNVKTRQHTGC
jgi:hypothetical protein